MSREKLFCSSQIAFAREIFRITRFILKFCKQAINISRINFFVKIYIRQLNDERKKILVSCARNVNWLLFFFFYRAPICLTQIELRSRETPDSYVWHVNKSDENFEIFLCQQIRPTYLQFLCHLSRCASLVVASLFYVSCRTNEQFGFVRRNA